MARRVARAGAVCPAPPHPPSRAITARRKLFQAIAFPGCHVFGVVNDASISGANQLRTTR